MKKWWSLALALLLLPLVSAQRAEAACPEESLQAKVNRAQVIVYGTVLPAESAAPKSHSVTLKKVYKGDPKNPALISHLEAYPLPDGSDHTFYLVMNEKGFYDLDACATHRGGPTKEETDVFGEGKQPPEFQGVSPFRFWVPVIAVVVGAGVVGLVLLTRKRDEEP